jgi:hypothetical protein
VGQQASVALLIASAFPTGAKEALIRAGLIAAGGAVQVVFTSAGLRLSPHRERRCTRPLRHHSSWICH